jgi:hypothetical protein
VPAFHSYKTHIHLASTLSKTQDRIPRQTEHGAGAIAIKHIPRVILQL